MHNRECSKNGSVKMIDNVCLAIICSILLMIYPCDLDGKATLNIDCKNLEVLSDKIDCYQTLLKSGNTSIEKEARLDAYQSLIGIYVRSGKFAEGMKTLESLKVWAETKSDPYLQYRYWHALGDYYLKLRKYEPALQAYNEAQKWMPEKIDHVSSCFLSNSLGVLYYNQGSNEKAIEHYLESLQCRLKFNDTISIAKLHKNIGNIYLKGYSDLNYTSIEGGKYHWDKAIELYESVCDTTGGIIDIYYNYAFSNLIRTDAEKIALLQKGISIAENNRNNDYLLDAYDLMSRLYVNSEKYLEAYEMQIRRNEILNEINIDLRSVIAMQSDMAEVEFSQTSPPIYYSRIQIIGSLIISFILFFVVFRYSRKWLPVGKILTK